MERPAGSHIDVGLDSDCSDVGVGSDVATNGSDSDAEACRLGTATSSMGLGAAEPNVALTVSRAAEADVLPTALGEAEPDLVPTILGAVRTGVMAMNTALESVKKIQNDINTQLTRESAAPVEPAIEEPCSSDDARAQSRKPRKARARKRGSGALKKAKKLAHREKYSKPGQAWHLLEDC